MKYRILLSMLAMLLYACGQKKEKPEVTIPVNEHIVTLTDAQISNAGIVTGPLQQKEMASVLKLNGKIDVPPQNMVSISVPMGGYLKFTKLLPGMHVTKGEVIAVVEDQQYIQLQQDYLTAIAKLRFLESDYRRQKELNQNQASSDKVFEQAEADYRTQRVLLTSLAAKLKLAGINIGKMSETNITRSINIYSPISGFVSRVNVNIGKYVAPTEVMFELVNPADIHLALQVFEKDVSRLFIGQKLMAYTNNNPEKKYAATILLIGKDLTADGHTEVHCHFEGYDKALIPGTYMNAEIDVKSNRGYVLPADAVVRFESRHFIYRQTGQNQFEMTEVTIGESDGGYTEIVLPTQSNWASAQFVTRGAYSLLMRIVPFI
ncbi:MAG: efflux RND transporter periplasmic adaptor subunit, partial [Sphingobacteriales bacterium]